MMCFLFQLYNYNNKIATGFDFASEDGQIQDRSILRVSFVHVFHRHNMDPCFKKRAREREGGKILYNLFKMYIQFGTEQNLMLIKIIKKTINNRLLENIG